MTLPVLLLKNETIRSDLEVRIIGLWDILKISRGFGKKRHADKMAVGIDANECVVRSQ